jgi:hypothetical protein
MSSKRSQSLIVPALTLLVLCTAVPAWPQGASRRADEAWGPRYTPSSVQSAKPKHPAPHDTLSRLRHWNEVAVNSSGLDHTPVPLGDPRIFGEQLGPARSSRAIAIVHIAIFEAVNAIKGGYQSYVGLPRVNPGASVDAAVAQAAHDTLNALFPSQAAACTALLAEDLARIKEGRQKSEGVRIGRQAAAATLALRAADGSVHPEPRVGIEFITSDDPGKWRQDPISLIPLALGAHWYEVTPFVMQSASQFRTPPPPSLDSPEYAAAFEEVQRLGGDGVTTPTERTAEQTEIGIFWAYDGTPSLCAPPKLYNQIAVQIAGQMGSDAAETARLLALVNTALADAGVASWESKYFYQFWRPIGGIREADAGTGPSGLGDGNPVTVGDLTFSPLGAPASNLTGPNFTPPFPAYPSGHAVFGGAVFETLRNFYGRDDIAFTFISDELNGVTPGNDGVPRALSPRSFTTLSQAEEENGQSRIYLGIHWSFDKTEGIAQGRRVADYVFENTFAPVRGTKARHK